MGRERVTLISSREEMIAWGKEFASSLEPNTILALSGHLGSGKTTFVQGLALGLGINEPIQSPTFVYLNQYQGRLSLYHFDLYRMKDEADFLGLGFEECLEADGVSAIEWPERIPLLLPHWTMRLFFSHQGTQRRIQIEE